MNIAPTISQTPHGVQNQSGRRGHNFPKRDGLKILFSPDAIHIPKSVHSLSVRAMLSIVVQQQIADRISMFLVFFVMS